MKRAEHEFPLTKQAYEHLKSKIDGILIYKTRYQIPDSDSLTIELDVWLKLNLRPKKPLWITRGLSGLKTK